MCKHEHITAIRFILTCFFFCFVLFCFVFFFFFWKSYHKGRKICCKHIITMITSLLAKRNWNWHAKAWQLLAFPSPLEHYSFLNTLLFWLFHIFTWWFFPVWYNIGPFDQSVCSFHSKGVRSEIFGKWFFPWYWQICSLLQPI